MIDTAQLGPFGWFALLTSMIAIWELAKRAVAKLLGENKPDVLLPGERICMEDYGNVQIPQEPHVEIVLDPPSGLHHSNPKEPYAFENDNCQGKYLYFHPPTGEATALGPGGMSYGEYFAHKSRLWEIRIQFRFKRPPDPDADMFFGIELEEYVPLSMATKQAQKMVLAAVNQAVGGLYQSLGDDPRATQGEREKPCCVLPLLAFDQFVETPEGQQPPSLSDPQFPTLGSRRYKRVAEYAEEIKALQQGFRVGPCYTLAFWGTSRFLDVLSWMLIGIPVATPMDLNRFAGKPPVYAVLYSLTPGPEGEKRHVQSRKRNFFRAALWSSTRRPDRAIFERLVGADSKDAPPSGPALKPKKSLRRRIARFLQSFETCTLRTGK